MRRFDDRNGEYYTQYTLSGTRARIVFGVNERGERIWYRALYFNVALMRFIAFPGRKPCQT